MRELALNFNSIHDGDQPPPAVVAMSLTLRLTANVAADLP
jgi:hypothetical protein